MQLFSQDRHKVGTLVREDFLRNANPSSKRLDRLLCHSWSRHLQVVGCMVTNYQNVSVQPARLG